MLHLPKLGWCAEIWRVRLSFSQKSASELLKLYAQILRELKRREVLRTFNSPTGDYAEWLFCQCFGWSQAPNSQRGFDAFDKLGVKYQIKAIRLTDKSKSRQMSAIRDLAAFDALAAIMFDDDFCVLRAAIIPISVVREFSSFTAHTNSYRFYLRDSIFDQSAVHDVTGQLILTQQKSD